jgi:hypothetical protein
MSLENTEMFYKYGCWNNANHRRLITLGEIFFCSPKYFNDPCDCALRFNPSIRKPVENLSVIRQLCHLQSPNLSETEIERKSQIIFSEGNFQNADNLRRVDSIVENYFYNKNGIFCLTRTRQNNLMWSHYANSHKGFCIGYSVQKLEAFFDKFIGDRKDINISTATEVEYYKVAPSIIYNPYNINDINDINRQFKVKPWDLRDEREIRYIMTGDININDSIDFHRRVIIDKDIITEIIIGCRMATGDREELQSIFKHFYPHAKIFISKMKPNSFDFFTEELVD